MIHYLKIENFGLIDKEVTIDFEAGDESKDDAYQLSAPDGKKLLKLAYIYGPNASGKTTVLKAFEFLRKLLLTPVNNKADLLDFEPFLFRDQPYAQSSRLELSFYADDLRYVYEIVFNKENILEEEIVCYQTAKATEIFTRVTDTAKRLARIHFGSRIKVPARERDLLESNTLHNNTVIGAYAKTNVDIPELEKLSRWFNQYISGMLSSTHNLTLTTASLMDQDPAIGPWINTFLNKADSQIKEVYVADPRAHISIPMDEAFPPEFSHRFIKPTNILKVPEDPISLLKSSEFYGGPSQRRIDFFHSLGKDKTYALSILAESNGTKRFFGLGGPLYELIYGSHFLCIDELETSLHPDLMTYFLQVYLLNARSSQLLITTHSLVLMENQDFLRKDALWFTEKQKDGSMDLYSAADFDSTTLRKDASVINAYNAGRLGAKPNLGSPYLIEK
jgi:AAA15 family ATPase/GTPase